MCGECGACQGDAGMEERGVDVSGVCSCLGPALSRAHPDLSPPEPPEALHNPNLPPPSPRPALPSELLPTKLHQCQKASCSAGETEPGKHDAERESQSNRGALVLV